MTSYIRMRLNIQNEKNWSQDRALRDPNKSAAKERMSLHSQLQLVSCLAGNNGRRTKQDQNTKSVFDTSQKNVMIDSLESSV